MISWCSCFELFCVVCLKEAQRSRSTTKEARAKLIEKEQKTKSDKFKIVENCVLFSWKINKQFPAFFRVDKWSFQKISRKLFKRLENEIRWFCFVCSIDFWINFHFSFLIFFSICSLRLSNKVRLKDISLYVLARYGNCIVVNIVNSRVLWERREKNFVIRLESSKRFKQVKHSSSDFMKFPPKKKS